MAEAKIKIIAVLKKYLEEVEKICHVEKAILFGSYAHGKTGRHSDIDIAIFSKNVDDKNRIEIMSRVIMLIDKLKLDIQPLVFSYEDFIQGDNDFIDNEIKKKGIEIM